MGRAGTSHNDVAWRLRDLLVREDVGNIDQLSFQAPLLPIAFGGGGPGAFGNFFGGTLATNPNALPPAGVLSPAYIPCLSV